jgi:hypothetical protein
MRVGKNQDLLDIAEALRVTRDPRPWFDEPRGVMANPEDWYTWDHQVAYGTTNTPPYMGRRNLTQGVDQRRGNCFYYNSNTTANFIFEAVRDHLIVPVFDGQPGHATTYGNPWFWCMRLNRSNGASGPGEKYQGISWGPPTNFNTPWQTQHASMTTTVGRVGLHWNYTLERWQLQVFGYDTALDQSQPPTLYTLPAYLDALTTDNQMCEAALMWVPGVPNPASPGNVHRSRLVAMINGRIGIDLNNDPFVTEMLHSFGSAYGPGIYWTNGSGGVEGAAEAGYYVGRYWMPLPRPSLPGGVQY